MEGVNVYGRIRHNLDAKDMPGIPYRLFLTGGRIGL